LGYHPPLALLEDRQGRLWIATNGGGVFCYDGARFQQYTHQDGLAYDRVMCLCEDR
jgi:ligand-binding sensor domain-containing protein